MEDNNQNKALLVMDVQNATMQLLKDNSVPFTTAITKAIQKARDNKIPVIYVVVSFRKGYPEINASNRSFARLKAGGTDFDTEEACRVHSSVAQQPDDIVVIKKRVSAFTGSDLEVILRAQGIRHLVLTGIATSGVVLSTLREAADKDFTLTVLSDCCADLDEEIHRVLTTKIFTRQADVITADEWKI